VPELTAEQRLILGGVKDTTRVLALGWLAALAIVAVKLLTRQETVTVAGVGLPVRYAWLVFAVFTALHVFKGGFLVSHLTPYVRRASGAEKLALFGEIRAETNPLLHGLLPRGARRPGRRLTRMDPRDPSSWMAYAAQLTVLVAVLPWSLERPRAGLARGLEPVAAGPGRSGVGRGELAGRLALAGGRGRAG